MTPPSKPSSAAGAVSSNPPVTSTVAALLIVIAVQAAAVVALLVQRTRRARAERTLRESVEEFRLRVDQAPVLIWTARPDTSLDYLNGYCEQLTGRSLEELRENGWLDFVHPEDVDRCLATYMPAFNARRPFLLEYRLRHADGRYRWFLATGVPKYGRDGTFSGYVGCDVDISERKDAEDRIQHLAGLLIEAQDAERARIARDLHDDVSQQLAGLSIAFSGLKHRLASSPLASDMHEDVRALQQRTLALAENVRHVSHDLHPTVLRHVGLLAALKTYCAELERPLGTVLRCSAEGDVESIAPNAALCLYRIAQEAVRNVVAHAGAGRAEVRLLRTDDSVAITISDDGKGFDVGRSNEPRKGLGLVSITERVRLAGGTVSIVSAPRKGTQVRASIPAVATVPNRGVRVGADGQAT